MFRFYNFIIKNVTDKYEFSELIKVFLKPDQFACYTEAELEEGAEGALIGREEGRVFIINEAGESDKNSVKRQLFEVLCRETGQRPPWGIITGVRPVKLAGELLDRSGGEEAAGEALKSSYFLSGEKVGLLMETLKYQREKAGEAPPGSVGIYVGIPFCPTRCLYCSFASNQEGEGEIARYLEALHREISYVGRRMKETGLFAETVYMGGGTPTTISAAQMDELLGCIEENIDLSRVIEYTVEAGRPDTITAEKLSVIKAHGVDRISINPQTMKAETLELIGRKHSPEDISEAFRLAKDAGFADINADVICGLPGETEADFAVTLDKVMSLKPSDITVHTLAVKRSSRLIDADKDYHYKHGETVAKMLCAAKDMLREAGYRPYYLYRQKHMTGAFENVGYCRDDALCVYNVRIMEERQTVIALGAGGISKMYYPAENRHERVANVTNYQVYIDRLDEMIERKEKNIFQEVK